MTGNAAIVALIVANLALVVGWVVSGTQRVAEDLVTERRTRYLALLTAVEKARRAGDATDIEPSVTAAELVATDEMLASGLIARLAGASTADEAAWADVRAAFLRAARHESQHNQAIRRRLRRASIYGEPPPTGSGADVPVASAAPDDPPTPDGPVNPA